MKTINCDECKVEFTFEENPKYPRKYCMNCSEAKKQQWKQKGSTAEDVEIIKTQIMDEAAKMDEQVYNALTETASSDEKPKTNGFKLTEENIRIGALTCAIAYLELRKQHDMETNLIIDAAASFEEYIRNGK